MGPPVPSPSPHVASKLTRSECLAALAHIKERVEPAIRRAWRECAGLCVAGLRGLLAPFDYGDIEVRVRISREPTLLGISMREGASACRACTDAVALDVLQEVDQFLQDHREWAVHLDGALLYP